MPSTAPHAVVSAFTPTGRLRASINLGNPILARRDAAPASRGRVGRPGARLRRAAGRRVRTGGVRRGGQVGGRGHARSRPTSASSPSIPQRGEGIRFTAPYVLIEGCYLVREDSPLHGNEEVDRAGTRVVVGKGSAYDLFLTRELKQATMVRAPSSPAVVDDFLEQGADVAAGVKQQLEADAARFGGLRLLPGRFMVIQQAMGCPKPGRRGGGVPARLCRGNEGLSGFVAQALQRHGIQGASVAPPALGAPPSALAAVLLPDGDDDQRVRRRAHQIEQRVRFRWRAAARPGPRDCRPRSRTRPRTAGRSGHACAARNERRTGPRSPNPWQWRG